MHDVLERDHNQSCFVIENDRGVFLAIWSWSTADWGKP